MKLAAAWPLLALVIVVPGVAAQADPGHVHVEWASPDVHLNDAQ